MLKVLGAVAAAALLCAGAAVAGEAVDIPAIIGEPSAAKPDDLPNPPDIYSRNGVLEATLTAKPSRITVAGRSFTSNVYNGLYIPPTLRLNPGDTLKLSLVDQIGRADIEIRRKQPTNVHYHGTDVTPKPPGDDVLTDAQPGETRHYVVPFPEDHPRGLHWYHPHAHGYVEKQILSGMSGMLIVEGDLKRHYPEFVDLRERVLVLKDIYLPGQDQNTAKIKTINSYLDPRIRARPNEWQVWRLGNLGADAFFHLALDGHDFWTIERDGNVLPKPERQASVFLSPGARATVLVSAGKAPGRFKLRSLKIDTGPQGDPNPEVVVGTLDVSGEPVEEKGVAARLEEPAAHRKSISPRAVDLKNAPIARERTFDFSESANGNRFFINGKQFDENVVDTTVRLGDVEKWTIRNLSGELHVFHLHQTAFLVLDKSEGVQEDSPGMRDVINLPYAQDAKPGVVTLIIPFTNPVMLGRFVYHCHVVGHEDAGMMQIIRVLPPKTAAEQLWYGLNRLAGLNTPPPWWPERARRAALLPEADELSAALRGEICVTPSDDEEADEPTVAASLALSGKGPIPPAAAPRE
ncbi:multicopper oxidase family protein [Hansschlegelia zhihuaiae]|uniref:Multicopper oxidase family protein n=1 Tax=Hansschlegelia zhihuaiae TaxID=405005 RepID=A0A4Q0MI86_9HYPH|nr:multicopper oxidase family protein [Hansschlegelia zhihuaiae]RXF73033.1 multicopper oxidase family protein [Hansschlegelia zhihuaiae]